MRKRAKQARYAYEAAAAVTTPKASKRLAKKLADLQGVLGDHQDLVVAAAWLEDAALEEERRDVSYVAGLLAGGLAPERRDDRSRWSKVWRDARHLHHGL